MKIPTKNWMSIADWAALNGWPQGRVAHAAFGHNEIEWTASGFVRHVPDTRQPPKYVKISKSDNP